MPRSFMPSPKIRSRLTSCSRPSRKFRRSRIFTTTIRADFATTAPWRAMKRSPRVDVNLRRRTRRSSTTKSRKVNPTMSQSCFTHRARRASRRAFARRTRRSLPRQRAAANSTIWPPTTAFFRICPWRGSAIICFRMRSGSTQGSRSTALNRATR